ncbi:5119_t:CDS:2, partial [Acaulospora colombiana]
MALVDLAYPKGPSYRGPGHSTTDTSLESGSCSFDPFANATANCASATALLREPYWDKRGIPAGNDKPGTQAIHDSRKEGHCIRLGW